MTNPAHSLSNLRDLVIPEAPSPWPTGPGVWVIAMALGLFAIVFGMRLWQTRKANAYRRIGLALLGDLELRLKAPESCLPVLRELNVILKRVALAAFPREQVASLYGKDWIDFLKGTCPESSFRHPLDPALTDSSHQAGVLTEDDTRSQINAARKWIQDHSVANEPARKKEP